MAFARKNILKAMKALYTANAALKAAVPFANTIAEQKQGPPFMVVWMTIPGKGPSFDENERLTTIEILIVDISADTVCDLADLVDAVYDKAVPSITGADSDAWMENSGERGPEYNQDIEAYQYTITYGLNFVIT